MTLAIPLSNLAKSTKDDKVEIFSLAGHLLDILTKFIPTDTPVSTILLLLKSRISKCKYESLASLTSNDYCEGLFCVSLGAAMLNIETHDPDAEH